MATKKKKAKPEKFDPFSGAEYELEPAPEGFDPTAEAKTEGFDPFSGAKYELEPAPEGFDPTAEEAPVAPEAIPPVVPEAMPLPAPEGVAPGGPDPAAYNLLNLENPMPVRSAAEEESAAKWGSAISQGIRNLPASTYRAGKGTIESLLSPWESTKTLGSMLAGLFQKAAGAGRRTKSVEMAEALIEDYAKTYGTTEGFQEKLAQDPAAIALDLSTLAGASGLGVKGAGLAAKAAKMTGAAQKASKIAATMQNIGATLDPVGGAWIVGKGIKKVIVPEKLANKIYKSGIRFNKDYTPAERERLAEIGLKTKTGLSEKGVWKLQEQTDGLKLKVDELIDDAVAKQQRDIEAGVKPKIQNMPVEELFKDFDALKKKYLATSGKPKTAARAIDAIKKQILDANKDLKREVLNPAEAQAMKREIHKEMEKHYTKLKLSTAGVEAQKTVARAAKEYLEAVVPEIKEYNVGMGERLDLMKAIESQVNAASNKGMLDYMTTLRAGAAGAAGGAGLAAAAVGHRILSAPRVKSRLAMWVRTAEKAGAVVGKASPYVRGTLLVTSKALKAKERMEESFSEKYGVLPEKVTDAEMKEMTRRLMQ